MESRFDDHRARGWREQYKVFTVSTASSLFYDDPKKVNFGTKSEPDWWEPVPGPHGVLRPVRTQFHNGTFYQLARRWMRRVGVEEVADDDEELARLHDQVWSLSEQRDELRRQIDTSAAGADLLRIADALGCPGAHPDAMIASIRADRDQIAALEAQVAALTTERDKAAWNRRELLDALGGKPPDDPLIPVIDLARQIREERDAMRRVLLAAAGACDRGGDGWDDVRLWLAEHPVCGLKVRVLTPEEAEASQNPFGPEYEIAALQSRVATLEVKVATQEAEIARANRNLDRWRGRAKRAEAELTALKARFVQHQNTWNTLLGEYIERERNLTR